MKTINRSLLMLGWFFAVTLFGILLTLLPAGTFARLTSVMMGGLVLVLAWGFRKKTAMFPEHALIMFSVFVLTMSIIWPQYVFFSAGGLPRVNPFSLSTALGVMLIATMLLYYKSFSTRAFLLLSEIKLIVVFFTLWMSWRVLSNLVSGSPVATNTELLREIIYVYSLFAYALLINQSTNGTQLLGRIIIGCTIFVGLAGVIEAIQGKNMFIGFAASGETGDVGDAIATIIADKIRGGAYRVQSVFSHPILFGQYLGAAAPIIFISLFFERSRFWKFMAIVALPLILIGVLKSGSRSGLLALTVSAIVLGGMLWVHILSNSQKYRGFAIAAVPIVLIAIFAAYGFSEHLIAGGSQMESSSSLVRETQLRYAFNAIPHSPIFGYGLGAAIQIAGVKTYLNSLTMDIFYLSVLLDSGWVGLILFMLMVLSLIFTSIQFVSRNSGRKIYYISAYIAAALSVLVTLGAVSMQQNIMFFLLAASVLAAAKYDSRTQ